MILMKFQYKNDEIQLLNEQDVKVGYALIPFEDEKTINVRKVFVDPSMRGGGVASQVMDEVYAFAKKEGLKVTPTCPYAVAWFKRKKDKQDILSDTEASPACPI